MNRLCLNCVKHEALKKLISIKGEIIPFCKICNSKNQKSLPCNNIKLANLFKSLLCFYYSEWEYNTEFGAKGIETLFCKSNEIFNFNCSVSIDMQKQSIMELVKPLDAPNNKGISIYSEYSSCHGEKNPPLVAIKDDVHPSLLFLENALKSSNNFLILEEYAYNLLSQFSGKIDDTISKGSKFFRARIGYKKRGVIASDNLWGSNYHYEPFKFSDIDAPPSIKASTGRMNREGVPYLYLSTDFETAIAEIRPHPGHYVSIGYFLSVQDLRIAKFYPLDIYDYSNNSKQLDDFLFLKSIDELFCTPIPPKQKHRYIMIQLLANILLKLGYDGISFRSSIHNGSNLTVFDATKFSYIEENNAVFKIEKLKYKFENIPVMISKNKYELVKEW